MSKIDIFEQDLLNDGECVGKLAILRGGLGTQDPTEFMNNAVEDYARGYPHNQFIEIHLDNPWVRVVITGINHLKYVNFDTQRLQNEQRV